MFEWGLWRAGPRSWAWWRGRRWIAAGRCGSCGYDLRSSEHRCPECGAVFGENGRPRRNRISTSELVGFVLPLIVVAVPCVMVLIHELRLHSVSAQYQQMANETSWKWPSGQNSVESFAEERRADSSIQFDVPRNEGQIFRQIDVRHGGHDVFQLWGTADSALALDGKTFVYMTMGTGARHGWTVVAVDLETGLDRWWSCPEWDLGRRVAPHDPYHLEIRGDVVVVWCGAHDFKYVAFIDLRTGNLLGRKVFWEKFDGR